MKLLKVSDLTTEYGQATILHDVDLHVDECDITLLLGSNGSGKTTLLKSIQGLVVPSSGQIFFKDQEITRWPAHKVKRLGIASAPEGRNIFPEMTVAENLKIGRFHMEDDQAQLEKSLDQVYDLWPRLQERENQLGGTLSGGEQGMLALGRALMGNPDLMILDEPSLGIQPSIVKQLFRTIDQINTEQGLTILFAEQNAKQSLEVANYCYLLRKGEVANHGTPEELSSNQFIQHAYLQGAEKS